MHIHVQLSFYVYSLFQFRVKCVCNNLVLSHALVITEVMCAKSKNG